jgi:hypothetical protein
MNGIATGDIFNIAYDGGAGSFENVIDLTGKQG